MNVDYSLDKVSREESECPPFYHLENDEFSYEEVRNVMEFRLVYEGSLKAAGNSSKHVKNKHAVRKAFHKQLAELWERHPTLNHYKHHWRVTAASGDMVTQEGMALKVGDSMVTALGRHFGRCGYQFIPLVNKHWGLVCGLNILFLRRENPGSLITQGGDIDNRIKTLLDALRIPENCGEVVGEPDADETPFYCLLESDALVTELNVSTDRLLLPLKPEQHESEIHLVLHVKVRAVVTNTDNIRLIS